MCERTLGDAPEVRVYAPPGFTFPYVPSYLHHILFELLKNSMRAVIERHGVGSEYPPLTVVISGDDSHEDVVIKVSDEGGGIPRSEVCSNTKPCCSSSALEHLGVRTLTHDTHCRSIAYGSTFTPRRLAWSWTPLRATLALTHRWRAWAMACH